MGWSLNTQEVCKEYLLSTENLIYSALRRIRLNQQIMRWPNFDLAWTGPGEGSVDALHLYVCIFYKSPLSPAYIIS